MANQPGRDEPFQFRLPWARQPTRRPSFQPAPHRPPHSTPPRNPLEPRTAPETSSHKQPPTAPEPQKPAPSTQRVSQSSSQNPPASLAPQPPQPPTAPSISNTNKKSPPPASSGPPSSSSAPKSLAGHETTLTEPPRATQSDSIRPQQLPAPISRPPSARPQPPPAPPSIPQPHTIQQEQLPATTSRPQSQSPITAPMQPLLSRKDTRSPIQAPPVTSPPEPILFPQIKSTEPRSSNAKQQSELMSSGETKPSSPPGEIKPSSPPETSKPKDWLQTKPEQVTQPSENVHPEPTPTPTPTGITTRLTTSEIQKTEAGATDVRDKFPTTPEDELNKPVQTTSRADEKSKQDVEAKQGTDTQTKSKDEAERTLIKKSNEKAKGRQRDLPEMEIKKLKSIQGASSTGSNSSSDSDAIAGETKPRTSSMFPNKGKETRKNSSDEHERSDVLSTIHQDETQQADRGGTFQKELKGGIAKLVQKLNFGQAHQPGHGNAVTVITLAGENRGASMKIIYDGTDQGKVTDVPTSSKMGKDKPDTNKIQATERNPKQRDDHITHGDHPMAANVNSNVQSINNSLLQESSCNERDPGVKMNFSHYPLEPINMEKKDLHGAFRTTTTNPAQKSTFEPQIRRRCLRGLLMESSEDDQENPQKQRRHGCRFNCDEKKEVKTGQGFSAENSNDNR